MGRGDKRTRKGKIYRGSYGKTRPGRIKKKKGAKKEQAAGHERAAFAQGALPIARRLIAP